MSAKSRYRLLRMKRTYRRIAAVISALVGTSVALKFGDHIAPHTESKSEVVLLSVFFGLSLGLGLFAILLGVLAAMQGMALRRGGDTGDGGKPKGRGS